MDAAVDTMVRVALVSLAACFMLSGCAALPFFGAACPEITDTSAWINKMPGPGQPSGGKLHVVELGLAERHLGRASPCPLENPGELGDLEHARAVRILWQTGLSHPTQAGSRMQGWHARVGLKWRPRTHESNKRATSSRGACSPSMGIAR